MLNQSLKKQERLHSKKHIKQLFSEGKSFFIYPFKVVYKNIHQENGAPVQILPSVSKRKIKSAVKRNRVKRLIREAYRKNKSALLEAESGKEGTLLIGFVYVADTIMDYHQLEKKIILILQRLKSRYEKGDR